SNTLIITPPDPQTTNEGNILGHSPRHKSACVPVFFPYNALIPTRYTRIS
ncbi:hypothetical protein ACTXQV_60435, partial [Klebsiella pneumoniae]